MKFMSADLRSASISEVGGIIAFLLPLHLTITRNEPEPWLERSKLATDPAEMVICAGQEMFSGWLAGAVTDGCGDET